MPIIRATDQELTLACGHCGAQSAIARDRLEAGDFNEAMEKPEPDLCRLPACADCGAVEFLVRTWDHHPAPQSQAARHRGLVNRLFGDLVQARRVNERCAAIFESETEKPPDLIPQSAGTEIDLPPGLGTWAPR